MSNRNDSFTRWIPLIVEGIVLIALGVIFAFNNHLPTKPKHTAVIIQPVLTNTPEPELIAETVTEPTVVPTETPAPTPTAAAINAVDYFLADTNQGRYADWIRKLSGEESVVIGGQEYTITTRYSYAMFLGQDNAKAPDYLMEVLKRWVPEEMITYEPYEYRDAMSAYTWYNIVVTFPGTVRPDE